MKDIARLITFLIVIALALRVQFCADESARKRRIKQFLIVVFSLTLVAGLARLDDWPFPAYPMQFYAGDADREISEIIVRVIDANGRETVADPFSWSPLFMTNLAVWLERQLPRLSPDEQQLALAYLLRRADDARGRRAIGAAKWLGPFAAPPDWGLYRRSLNAPVPYRGIRVYRATWRPSHPIKRLELLGAYDER